MGNIFGSKSGLKCVLITGPEGSGKSNLLYQLILRKKEWKATPTVGFNYEEISNDRGDKCGIFDMGGSESVNYSLHIYSFFVDSPRWRCSLFTRV